MALLHKVWKDGPRRSCGKEEEQKELEEEELGGLVGRRRRGSPAAMETQTQTQRASGWISVATLLDVCHFNGPYV